MPTVSQGPPGRILGVLVAGVLVVQGLPADGQDLVLGDFNGTGFDYAFDDFVQTLGPNSVRLTDTINGWGGAGITNAALDFGSYSDGRLVLDITPLPSNATSIFTLELIEEISNGQTIKSGKWDFVVAGLTPGQPASLVSSTLLSDPTSGIGDYQNLDLSQVTQWQLLGEFGGAGPFDIEFDRIAVSNSASPPPPYPGAEPDAPWRSQAASQIDQIRKADLLVEVVDASGAPVPGATVGAAMQQHEFGFGSAVQAWRLRNSQPQHNQYKAKVAELFNVATLENNLKWPPWEGEWGGNFTQQGAINALDWLNGQGIDGRGHVLVWPGESNLPNDLQQLLSDGNLTPAEQQTVRNRITNHIASVMGAVDGKVVAWDVINETRTNNDLMQQLSEGDLAMVDWLNQAAAGDPEAARYINDFGILNTWGAGGNRDQYFNTIQYLIDQGASLDGIGFQGHFSSGDLTGPEELWQVVDQFDQLGLAMQVTEFDINTTDEELQAAYTRDFLTAMFAHEGIDDIVLWGFWEDAHWRPDAALYRSDWSIKPNGQAYLDLVFGEWWTDETLSSDANGEAEFSGFKGDYGVTATAGPHTQQAAATLTDGGATLQVELAFLLGDYNGDGSVDAADYSVWRDALGQTGLAPFTGADGDGDGQVTQADYGVWASRFGATPFPGASVPEPSTLGLALMAFLAAQTRGRVR